MSNNTGVFGLSGYNDKNLEGLIPDKTRESYREYGYFNGGSTLIMRIDYSNDTQTSTTRGNTHLTKSGGRCVENSNFGYFCGAQSPSGSSVERIDYSNDNQNLSIRGSLTNIRYDFGGASNNNYGYCAGGFSINLGGATSNIERINFSSDLSQAQVRLKLTQNNNRLSGTGNSNYGWFGGGEPEPSNSRIERIDYTNDLNNAIVRSSLSFSRGRPGATGNSNFGYFGGGARFPTVYSIVDRINYSNDTSSVLVRGPLSLSRTNCNAIGNSNFGYFCGGQLPASTSRVDRVDYSNDTITASIRGSLSVDSSNNDGVSSHSFGGSPISQYGVFAKPFGYFGINASMQRLDFSSDTSATIPRTTISGVATRPKAAGNANYAWIGGGLFTLSSRIYRFDYSNDNAGAPQRGPLSSARGYFAATGNSNFGYFSGGSDTPGTNNFSIVDRINYSNDTATASVRGPLAAVMYSHTGFSTFNYGYFTGGGSGPTTKTFVYRIDYSNDNSTTSARSPLQNSRRLLASSQNSSYSFVAGGDVGGTVNSIVERIDFANDTATTSVRGPLSVARRELTGTGTQNFGYFSSGLTSPGAAVSTVDRIDYANDTATATIVSSIFNSRTDYGLAATSFGGATDFQPTQTFFDIQSMKRIEDTTNASVKKRALGSFGYWIGGSPTSSIIQRLDFSNDLSNASIRSTTSMNTYDLGSTSTNNYGWSHGGDTGIAPISFTDRIDFSNDTAKPLNRSVFAGSRQCGASGNLYYGWVYSGYDTSRIIRLDYSNDLGGFLTRNNLTIRKRYPFGVGNFNYGWICGGQVLSGPFVTRSTIERLDYSNDNVKPSVRGSLTASKYRGSTTGNLNFGYYGGGRLSPSTGLLISTIERINYSNDTSNAIVRTSLSAARYNLSATGNNNFGYFGHGGVSTVERLDYSNDSASTSIRGPLVNSLRSSTATTNARSS